MIQYRSFHNDDSPQVAEIWNAAFIGRGAVRLRHSSALENYVLSKPYFDPAGLIVAEEDGQRVGFAHAGFRAAEDEASLSRAEGVICLLGVLPSHRRKGIGSGLLHRSEAYLTERGAQTIFAGPMRPLNPFYLGLYGGSELPGFLATDAEAQPFFERHGYAVSESCLVFQRNLLGQPTVVDPRFTDLRRRYDVSIAPRTSAGSWWEECVLGPIETVEVRMEEKLTGRVVARTRVWDMEGFSWRWGQPAVGILTVEVRPDHRRLALAKFLLTQLMRYLQEQFFNLVEVQAMQSNEAAVKLYQSVGFQQVDIGRVFKKAVSGSQ